MSEQDNRSISEGEATDPSARLARLASQPTPTVDPAFANRLETDLRLAMGERADHRLRPWWQPVAALVASAVLVLGGWLAFRSSTPSEVVMTAADDAAVVFPNGESAEGAAGLGLPDGTRISVGANGSAVVGGVVLGPGAEAVVVDGRVEIDALAEEDPVTSGSTTTVAQPPSTVTTAGSVSATNDTTARTATTDSRPALTTDAERSTTPASRPPERPSTTRTETITTSTTAVTELSVDLTVEVGRVDQLILDWVVRGDSSQVATWEVKVVQGDRQRVVLTLADPSVRRAIVERLESLVSYRIIGRDSSGRAIVSSTSIPSPSG